MLFILAMEPLHLIFKAAEEALILKKIDPRRQRFRCSFYADDVALFIPPEAQELTTVKNILHTFARISGLHTNPSKTEVFPIACDNLNVESLLNSFMGNLKTFPCNYLGIPLHTRKLRKIDLQPLVDKVGARIPGWKGRFFTSAGREVLVKTTLTATPIYHLTVLPQMKWVFKKIDRFRRAFLWKGEDPENVNAGSSLINWQEVCKPKNLGGLGILNLEKFARALRLRWLWYNWKDDTKPRVNMSVPCDETDRCLFRAGTKIEIGDGRKTSFWLDNWLDGQTPKDLAPTIFRLAKRKSNSLHADLNNNHWLSLLNPITSLEEVNDLVQLGGRLQNISLQDGLADEIIWRWTENGVYSEKSAYLAQFQGSHTNVFYEPLWTTSAEPKHRFFGWLVLHQRTLTAENLLR